MGRPQVMASQPSCGGLRRTVAIATKHHKELQFGPPLRRLLGLDLVVAAVDTDELGTFTGEVARPANQLDTARRKARWAIEHAGTRFGLSSEGAFGPHPDAPFVPIGLELAVFIDAVDGIEVIERLICGETNFAHVMLTAADIPAKFLGAVGFPEHAVVVSPTRSDGPFVKGVQDRGRLDSTVAATIAAHGTACVQTDMRAHLNPTRQRALAQLAELLAARLATGCPSCAAPGWGVIASEPGLRCESCARPTSLTAADRYGCASNSCRHQELRPRDGAAPPASCGHCNP